MGFLLIGIFLVICVFALNVTNFFLLKYWLDVAGFVGWIVTAVYIVSIGLFLGFTTPKTDRDFAEKYCKSSEYYIVLDELNDNEFKEVTDEINYLNDIIFENREYCEKYTSDFWFGLFKHPDIAEYAYIN